MCLLVRHDANAKPAAAPSKDPDAVPFQVSVSEVSKDGHIIHNRLTFDCQAADKSSWPPKEIDCVTVQQDLQEPSPPPSRGDLDKQVAEMVNGDKPMALCQELTRQPKGDESQQETEFRSKVGSACRKADRAAVVAALTDVLRKWSESASQTCSMMTIIRRTTFEYVRKGIWVSRPDPSRICTNVADTGTLRRDANGHWNYTEVTVATPSKDSLCHAESGTTEFTWRKAITGSPLNCRYVEM